MSRDSEADRRASDASVRGMSMEARMARIEAMMEALLRDRDDTAFSMPPLDPINPVLAFMGQQPTQSSPPHLIHLGNRPLPFPSPAEYEHYLSSFFTDVHLSHPCIDEAAFRSRSEQMLASTVIPPAEGHFLALNYIIFACCDVLLNVTPADAGKPIGWRWAEIADHVLDKKSLLGGSGDVTLIQCLLFQALYYTLVDMPGPAYNTIGFASRLVFQHSLHQQSTWTDIDALQAYERVCVFWNVFVTDRFISLACARPYTIHETDIQVELPVELFNRAILPTQLHLEDDPRLYMNQYLQYIILWARYTGNTVDGRSIDNNAQHVIDAQISRFLDHDLPGLRIPYTQPDSRAESPLKILLVQKKTDFVLWGFRSIITSLQYDDNHAAHFSQLAVSTINRMAAFNQDGRRFSLRHPIISSLCGALLVLCSLLVREPVHNRPVDVEAFQNTVAMLKDLSYSQPYAKRVLGDFLAVIRIVEGAVDGKDMPKDVAELFPYKSPSPLINFGEETRSLDRNYAPRCGVVWL
ncbi:hypothetical protein BDW02DRAFT_574240 [Decorospora gaudefroyi]|uniref:Xylanolytic transcriptional activator regulatory domain-containing protein n=1 Tax=Decorospora gaudefroyi TaxID=184978 RepID=A0A6A5JWU9_9PLEO|nr:hypothetical protein BDW02DRAFT_574240 [Decorospora gaudefroyi]